MIVIVMVICRSDDLVSMDRKLSRFMQGLNWMKEVVGGRTL